MTYPSQPQRQPETTHIPHPELRILFLDDDPHRAEIFLAKNPQAIWVETVPDCLAKLEEPWDEVHLDHDLGGEQYVTHDREDCGMEVVRWLSLTARPHLQQTRFVVHSHNPNGATMMGMQLMVNGYKVEVRPFGETPVETSTPSNVVVAQQSTPAAVSAPSNAATSRVVTQERSLMDSLRHRFLKLLRPRTPGLDPALLEQIRTIAERRSREAQSKSLNSNAEESVPPAPSVD